MIGTISVKYMLMLILITILLIGLVQVVVWLTNQYRTQMCVQQQVKDINNINDVVKEVLETGMPKVEKLKINSVCAECMWYNDTSDYQHIEIKFRYKVTPYPVNVSVPWNGVSTEYGCENSNMMPGETHTLYITPNEVSCTSCEV